MNTASQLPKRSRTKSKDDEDYVESPNTKQTRKRKGKAQQEHVSEQATYSTDTRHASTSSSIVSAPLPVANVQARGTGSDGQCVVCGVSGATHACVVCHKDVHNFVKGCSTLTDDEKQLCNICSLAASVSTTAADDEPDEQHQMCDQTLGDITASDKDFEVLCDAARDLKLIETPPSEPVARKNSAVERAITEDTEILLHRTIAEKRLSCARNLAKAREAIKINSVERKKSMAKAWDVYRARDTNIFDKKFQRAAVEASLEALPTPAKPSEHDANVYKADRAWRRLWSHENPTVPFKLDAPPASRAPPAAGKARSKPKSIVAPKDNDDDVDDKVEDDDADGPNCDDARPDDEESPYVDADGEPVVFSDSAADANITVGDALTLLDAHKLHATSTDQHRSEKDDFLLERFAFELKTRSSRRRALQAEELMKDACPYCHSTSIILYLPERRLAHLKKCAAAAAAKEAATDAAEQTSQQ